MHKMATMIKRNSPTQRFHRSVEYNGTIYLSGLAADERSGGMYEQTALVLKKIDKFLADAGTDKSKLLTVTVYITDFSMKPEMDCAWLEWLKPDCLSARTTVAVADLGPGCLVEMTAVAAK